MQYVDLGWNSSIEVGVVLPGDAVLEWWQRLQRSMLYFVLNFAVKLRLL